MFLLIYALVLYPNWPPLTDFPYFSSIHRLSPPQLTETLFQLIRLKPWGHPEFASFSQCCLQTNHVGSTFNMGLILPIPLQPLSKFPLFLSPGLSKQPPVSHPCVLDSQNYPTKIYITSCHSSTQNSPKGSHFFQRKSQLPQNSPPGPAPTMLRTSWALSSTLPPSPFPTLSLSTCASRSHHCKPTSRPVYCWFPLLEMLLPQISSWLVSHLLAVLAWILLS